MKIQDLLQLCLRLSEIQTVSHEYEIIDFDLNYRDKYQFIDRPDCVYLAFKDYDDETILDVKNLSKPSQNFSIFKSFDRFFIFTWEPFITRFVVYIFEHESEIKPFLLKNKNHLFEI